MSTTKLQLTEFYIEKLKNVVNVGQSSAYQILTSQGTVLGTVGRISNTDRVVSANNDFFDQAPVAAAGSRNRQSWIKMALNSLRSQ